VLLLLVCFAKCEFKNRIKSQVILIEIINGDAVEFGSKYIVR